MSHLSGSYAILEFGADNRLDDAPRESTSRPVAPDSAIVDQVPVGVEREGDGVLKIGSLLPETGSLAFLGPPEFAGLEFAIDEINAAGGVLGAPVEYSQGDSGDTSTDIASVTSDRLIGEGVDAIIGAASSSVTLTVIDKITAAGVIMFSPANTSIDADRLPRQRPVLPRRPAGQSAGCRSSPSWSSRTATPRRTSSTSTTPTATASPTSWTTCSPPAVSRCSVTWRTTPPPASFDSEVGEVVAADPDAIVLISFDEGSRILRTMVEQGIGPTVEERLRHRRQHGQRARRELRRRDLIPTNES